MRNVLEYLEISAKKFPNKVAFIDSQQKITFGELESYAKAVGTWLSQTLNITNRPIGILVDRSIYSIVAMMAVLESGNYYVPLDSKMPQKRLKAVLDQIDTGMILYNEGDAALARELQHVYPTASILEHINDSINETILANRRDAVLDIDPIYMLFTSGSTGTPKGIVVSHCSVIDFTDWMGEACQFSEKDVLANQAPFYFDTSVKNIYTTLKYGASCYLIEKKLFLFPVLLIKALEQNGVTALAWATSAFNLIANSGILEKASLPCLRKVIVGGEALRAKQLNIWKKYFPEVEYTNMYGPTEVTVDCAWYRIDCEYGDEESIPIGRACANKEVFLLDENLKPVKHGEVGEICVRGKGVASGYFKDEERSAKAFIQDPRNTNYPQKIYRTGDLAYYNEKDLLIFVSRQDEQIKHMGYRIELGELEVALNAIAGLNAAIAFFDKAQDKIVCMYEGDIDNNTIIRELRKYVPKYMFPNIFRHVEKMPLNANDKIDRKKLKEAYFHETSC